MTSHRIKDRRKLVRSGVLVCVSGVAVIFRMIAWVESPLMDDLVGANTECCFYSGHSGHAPVKGGFRLNKIVPTEVELVIIEAVPA
jgi:hypothetical protein